jgi:replicative DNA helicase
MIALASVSLIEPDIEATVLGSIISYPDVMAAIAEEINADWFADPACRMFVEAALDLHRKGHKITPKVLIAAVSPAVEVDGLTRSQFFAAAMAQAMPLAYLSGSLAILRDRWARRALAAEGQNMILAAAELQTDPFTMAAEVIGALDSINVATGENAVGSLYQGNEVLLSTPVDDSSRSPTTGIEVLDELLNGYAPGKLYVVAGRPGMGKSAFACSSLRKTAEAGHGVKLFSLEMGREEISARCIADTMDDIRAPGFGSILRNNYDMTAWGDALVNAHESHKSLLLSVDATPSLTFSQIASRSRKAKATLAAMGKKLAVVCIDHMGLVAPSDRYRGNKVAEAGEISGQSKALAKELGCCVLLLCQLNRGVEGREDKKPSLADLRWSGDIEQDADVVAFLYREAYYLQSDPACDPTRLEAAKHRVDFLVRKNRNGEACDVTLWCSIGHSAFRDRGPRP